MTDGQQTAQSELLRTLQFGTAGNATTATGSIDSTVQGAHSKQRRNSPLFTEPGFARMCERTCIRCSASSGVIFLFSAPEYVMTVA